MCIGVNRQPHFPVSLFLSCFSLASPHPLSLLLSLYLTPPFFNSAIFSLSLFLSLCLCLPLCLVCAEAVSLSVAEGVHFIAHVFYR